MPQGWGESDHPLSGIDTGFLQFSPCYLFQISEEECFKGIFQADVDPIENKGHSKTSPVVGQLRWESPRPDHYSALNIFARQMRNMQGQWKMCLFPCVFSHHEA